MWVVIPSFVCGVLFGFGLLISHLTDPMRVLGFLDIFGDRWDPTLAIVIVGAGAATAAGYAVARLRGAPLLAGQSFWPTLKGIDASLISGAVLFGIGWGLAGVCPGPALVNLSTWSPRVAVFVVAMALGIQLHDAWRRVERAAAAAQLEAAMVDG